MPMPRVHRMSIATLLPESAGFLTRVRVRRSEPNACALMTASVFDMGGSRSRSRGEGEEERECGGTGGGSPVV